MKKVIAVLLLLFLFVSKQGLGFAAAQPKEDKVRLLVVSSYHREYAWSQETNAGLCAAMLKFGYFENQMQAEEFSQKDHVETAAVVVTKLWMDTKRKKSKKEKAQATADIKKFTDQFNPDLILLGDDNAANYVGNQFLDAKIPIVFWGVNNTPVKYGIVEDIQKPGHNITGVYQPGYILESIGFLKSILPDTKSVALLSDATTSGRNHAKKIEHLAYSKQLPFELRASVITNDFEEWQRKALELQNKVDAFFLAQYSGLTDKNGTPVPAENVAAWYLHNIQIPEAVSQGQFIKQGMLCGADDSGFNQGYEAVVMAHDILTNGLNPAEYPCRAPHRGPLMVNRQRAAMLGIELSESMGIEEYIEKASSLAALEEKRKKRILVIDSYHKEYAWSQACNEGFCDAMRKLGFIDDERQIRQYNADDYIETSTAILKKIWMDTKRKKNKGLIEQTSLTCYKTVKKFQPDLVFLGDDNAFKYVGTHLLDTQIPVVFWGVNFTPVKHGLVESLGRPGHNLTGVYQSGYYRESLELLQTLYPSAKTFAILSDKTITARSHLKAIEFLARQNKLPLKLITKFSTDNYSEWRKKALELQKTVDAFYLVSFSGLQDDAGAYVPETVIAKWYINNITIPETTTATRIETGLLCSAIDSGYRQGYEAAHIAYDIFNGATPASYPPRSPQRGPLAVNKTRAKMLGITLTDSMGIEQIFE